MKKKRIFKVCRIIARDLLDYKLCQEPFYSVDGISRKFNMSDHILLASTNYWRDILTKRDNLTVFKISFVIYTI